MWYILFQINRQLSIIVLYIIPQGGKIVVGDYDYDPDQCKCITAVYTYTEQSTAHRNKDSPGSLSSFSYRSLLAAGGGGAAAAFAIDLYLVYMIGVWHR